MSAPTLAAEAAAPAEPRPEGKNTGFVFLFIGLMMSMLLGSLGQTVLSTALPTIVGELDGVDRMSWVVTVYVLASTVVMPVYGRISDLLGRKPVLATATLLFLHSPRQGAARQRIDCTGMVLVAVATSALVLVCTWGGSEYDWGSWQILGLIAVTVVFSALFVRAERRAESPIIPVSLFASRDFVLPTVAALLTGMAMFGVVGYMPTYIQMVSGVDATEAGLLMTPMMAGVLVASVVSGQLVSRTGRYKVFPVLGSGVIAVGLWLLSTLAVDEPTWLICLYMSVLGIGIGLSMQILIVIVQNAFADAMVGTATAAVNFFRQVGATVGTAVVGSVFASRLTDLVRENMQAVKDDLAAQAAAGHPDMDKIQALRGVGGGPSFTPESVTALPGPARRTGGRHSAGRAPRHRQEK